MSNFGEILHDLIYNNFDIDPITGCWIYKGGIDSENGYGRVQIDGIRYGMHRLSAAYFLGLDLNNSEQFACHKCNNRSCINPSHLYIGDNKSNQLDFINNLCKKGHELKGDNIIWHKRANGNYFRNCRICKRLKESEWAKNNRLKLKIAKGEN